MIEQIVICILDSFWKIIVKCCKVLYTKFVQKIPSHTQKETESQKYPGNVNPFLLVHWDQYPWVPSCSSPRSQLKIFNYGSSFWVRLKMFWMTLVYSCNMNSFLRLYFYLKNKGSFITQVMFWIHWSLPCFYA